jgi:hypothetical protein
VLCDVCVCVEGVGVDVCGGGPESTGGRTDPKWIDSGRGGGEMLVGGSEGIDKGE